MKTKHLIIFFLIASFVIIDGLCYAFGEPSLILDFFRGVTGHVPTIVVIK